MKILISSLPFHAVVKAAENFGGVQCRWCVLSLTITQQRFFTMQISYVYALVYVAIITNQVVADPGASCFVLRALCFMLHASCFVLCVLYVALCFVLVCVAHVRLFSCRWGCDVHQWLQEAHWRTYHGAQINHKAIPQERYDFYKLTLLHVLYIYICLDVLIVDWCIMKVEANSAFARYMILPLLPKERRSAMLLVTWMLDVMPCF